MPSLYGLKRFLAILPKWKRVKPEETSRDSTFHNRGPVKISDAEIKRATNDFSSESVIREGGFWKLYKGTLDNVVTVAVKRYGSHRPGSMGFREFRTELLFLSQIRHPNIISFFGYCHENSEMILVLEYMENGNLSDHLNLSAGSPERCSSRSSKLSWEQRLQICIDTAEALHYLHTGWDTRVIHGDVKPFNIMLDENFKAKVADFGVADLGLSDSGPLDVDETYRTIRGTPGYVDPAYFMTSTLTEKSDVYSFGVLLLEVLCGRRLSEMVRYEEENTRPDCYEIVWRKQGHLKDMIDPVLVGTINPDSLRLFCETSEKCFRINRKERPSMREVLWNLELALELQHITSEKEWSDDGVINVCSELLLQVIQHYPSYSSVEENGSGEEDDPPAESDVHAMIGEVFSPIRSGR